MWSKNKISQGLPLILKLNQEQKLVRFILACLLHEDRTQLYEKCFCLFMCVFVCLLYPLAPFPVWFNLSTGMCLQITRSFAFSMFVDFIAKRVFRQNLKFLVQYVGGRLQINRLGWKSLWGPLTWPGSLQLISTSRKGSSNSGTSASDQGVVQRSHSSFSPSVLTFSFLSWCFVVLQLFKWPLKSSVYFIRNFICSLQNFGFV